MFGITAGDKRGVHYWENAVADKMRFEMEMFRRTDRQKFDDTFILVRKYRNKFLAHLDQVRKMNLPILDVAQQFVWFYHQYIVSNEAQPADLAGLPTDLEDYYRHCEDEAQKIYKPAS